MIKVWTDQVWSELNWCLEILKIDMPWLKKRIALILFVRDTEIRRYEPGVRESRIDVDSQSDADSGRLPREWRWYRVVHGDGLVRQHLQTTVFFTTQHSLDYITPTTQTKSTSTDNYTELKRHAAKKLSSVIGWARWAVFKCKPHLPHHKWLVERSLYLCNGVSEQCFTFATTWHLASLFAGNVNGEAKWRHALDSRPRSRLRSAGVRDASTSSQYIASALLYLYCTYNVPSCPFTLFWSWSVVINYCTHIKRTISFFSRKGSLHFILIYSLKINWSKSSF